MTIDMVKGYNLPPGMTGDAAYGDFGDYHETSVRPYWYGVDIHGAIPALDGYSAQAFPCFGAGCRGYGDGDSPSAPGSSGKITGTHVLLAVAAFLGIGWYLNKGKGGFGGYARRKSRRIRRAHR